MDNPAYALGHSDEELERLRVQSRFVEPITRQFFQEAGISAGMRVLDVGSGAGDVAFLTADLVGETGGSRYRQGGSGVGDSETEGGS
jgi:hypothetical protein